MKSPSSRNIRVRLKYVPLFRLCLALVTGGFLLSNIAWATDPDAVDPPKGDLYGLIVGITHYNSGLPDLKGAAEDALDFSELLKEQRSLYRNIHLKVLVNERATRARIQRTLDHGFNLAGKDDYLVFFFSGHGVVDPKMQSGWYLMAYDSKPGDLESTAVHVSSDKIVEHIEAKASLMITDTCHSKEAGDLRFETAGPRLMELIHRTAPIPNRILLASTRTRDLVWKYSPFRNGAFTHYLLEGLRGEADQDNDSCVTVKEASDYAIKELANFTGGAQRAFFEGIADEPFRLSTSRPVSRRALSKTHKPTGALHALIVGISDYLSKSIPDLRFGAKDAKDFARLLGAQRGLYKNTNLDVLVDKNATKRNIEDCLARAFKIAKEDDTLLFFFSGHGETIPERDDEYFAYVYDSNPGDVLNTGLALSGMRMIKEVKARRAIVIYDTCFAGSSSDLQTSHGAMGLKDFARLFRDKPNRVIIASSSTPEQAREFQSLKNGVFTHFLLKGLDGEGDSNGDGIVSVAELYDYVSKATSKETNGKQNPTLEGRLEGLFPLGIVPARDRALSR